MAIASIPETAGPGLSSPKQSLVSLPSRRSQAPGRSFYVLAGVLVALVAASTLPQVVKWIPNIHAGEAWGGLILIGLGLLRLSYASQPLPTILGWLTILSGFEILYAPIEQSPFAAGLLVFANLGLALTGAYLILAPHMEENE